MKSYLAKDKNFWPLGLYEGQKSPKNKMSNLARNPIKNFQRTKKPKNLRLNYA